MRLQLEGENNEQTPGDVYEEGIREAIAQKRECWLIGKLVFRSQQVQFNCGH
jgi:hypothetical protein